MIMIDCGWRGDITLVNLFCDVRLHHDVMWCKTTLWEYILWCKAMKLCDVRLHYENMFCDVRLQCENMMFCDWEGLKVVSSCVESTVHLVVGALLMLSFAPCKVVTQGYSLLTGIGAHSDSHFP